MKIMTELVKMSYFDSVVTSPESDDRLKVVISCRTTVAIV